MGFSPLECRGVREGRGVRGFGGRGSGDGAAAQHRMYDWRHARKALKDRLDTVYTNTHTQKNKTKHMSRMK